MKTFKQFDLIFSIILIILFALLTAIMQDLVFMVGYFVVGGWQLISMIAHAANGWFTSKGSARYIYHRVVGVLLVLTVICFAIPSLLMCMMFFMLFAAPPMALIYAVICRNEYELLKIRALIQLK